MRGWFHAASMDRISGRISTVPVKVSSSSACLPPLSATDRIAQADCPPEQDHILLSDPIPSEGI